MTDHPSSQQLSDLLDGQHPAALAADLETHLAGCAACAALLEDLRAVAARARALRAAPPPAPSRDLWPGIAAAIGEGRHRQAGGGDRGGTRFQFTALQLAAGIVLVLLAGGAMAALLRGPGEDLAERAAAGPAITTVAAGPGGYDQAIADLRRELDLGRGRLDTATVRVVEQSLRGIDRAIADAEAALAADSTDPYIHEHLRETRMRKLDLLRQAVRLGVRAS